jgi:hypothetical protein
MNPDQLKKRFYLGDGVYIGHDGYRVWLYTDNGVEVTNQIAFDPIVLAQLYKLLGEMNGSESA